jgi:membrane protein YdbS with pleckstrin-like domain
VSNFAIKKLVLIYIHKHKKEQKISTLQLLIANSPFCHVLVGAICHVVLFVMFSLAPYLSLPELVLVRMYTFFVTMFGDPSARTQKTWRDTSTSSTHHHDESLLL